MQKSVFLSVWGDSPTNRVLDFLVVHQEFDHSMTDIARGSGVGYSTLKLVWPRLEQGVVIPTRTVGRARMFRLNLSNPCVKKWEDFYWTAVKAAIPKSSKKGVLLETSRASR